MLTRALRGRDARLLVVSAAASRSGDLLATTALAVHLFERTGSVAWVGAAGVVRMVPYLLLSAPAGMLGDRFPRRRVLAVSALGGAATMAALAVAAASGASPEVLLALAGIGAVLDSPYPGTAAALTADVVPPEHLAGTNSALATIENVAGLVGPLAAVAALAIGGPMVAYALNAATFGAAAACVVLVRSTTQTAKNARHRTGPGRLGALVAPGPIRTITGALLCAGLLHGAETVLLVLVAAHRLGTGADGLALLTAAVGAGGLVGAPLAARWADRAESVTGLAVALVMVAGPIAGLALVHDQWLACSLLMAQGVALVAFDVIAMTALQRAVPADIRAGVLGATGSLMAGGVLVATALTPLLVAAAGLGVTLFVVGAGAPAAVVLGRLRQGHAVAAVGRAVGMSGVSIVDTAGVAPLADPRGL